MKRERRAGGWLIGFAGAAALAALFGPVAVLIVGALGALVGIRLLLGGEREEVAPGQRADEATRADAVALLLEAIEDPMLHVVDGHVVRANGAARALFGDHVVDEDIRLAIRHPSAADCLERARPGVPCRAMLNAIGSDGRRYEMQVSHAGEDARLVRLVDRASAAVVEKVRTDFVANASHELRTPLATLIGFIETLEDDGVAGDGATRGRFLKIMMGEARRMQQLVDDLISLSRIEGERFQAPAEPVSVAGVAEEVRRTILAAQRLPPERIALTVEASDPIVPGDRGQLVQLLHNLVGNALKYGRAGAPVRLLVGESDGRRLLLQVADEGEGIAAEHLPRVTERFYRVDPGRSRALGGTGLGLAIVKHIVERHRGRLAIDSRQGVGTTVTVTLPRMDADERA